MKWIPKLTKDIKEIETETVRDTEPVSIKDIEQVIELLDVAKKINAYFKVKMFLTIGEFCIDSDSFNSMKVLKKNKTEEDRLVISHYDALLSTETTIKVKDIYGFTVDVGFSDEKV